MSLQHEFVICLPWEIFKQQFMKSLCSWRQIFLRGGI